MAKMQWKMAASGWVLGALLMAAPAMADDVAPADLKEAEQIFAQRCSTCHGAAGKGDGAASAALNPKPRDLSNAEWQKSVDDAHIEKIVVGGGPSVGKSPLMPPNPDLAGKPGVVKGLRKLVRGFGGQ